MPIIRKRRAQVVEPDPESSESESQNAPEPQRRRANDAPQDDMPMENGDDGGYGSDEANHSAGGVVPLARKMCRYALSCEYARQPIRRADISAKVLGNAGGRMFKSVFAEAQNMLRETFGMEMVELPAREKVTLQARRTAQTQQGKAATSTGAFVLVSTLPPKYRAPDIIPPPAVPTTENESTYVAIYTFICTTIYLHGGRLPEAKLERYLRRLNADRTTPLGSTDELFKRLIRDQYIVKHVDRSNPADDVTEYMVGPRGKVEVGEDGASGLVRTVYGGSVPDLEKKLERSLGLNAKAPARDATKDENSAGNAPSTTQAQRKSQRTQRRRQESSDEEEESEEGD